MLDKITLNWASICNLMIFVIENSEFANEISDQIYLKLKESNNIDHIISLLYLISDILYNSNSKIIESA